MTAQIEAQQFSMASYIADSVGNQVKLRINSLTLIANMITPELLTNPGKLREFLRSKPLLSNLFQTGVAVISVGGIVIADYPVISERAGGSVSDREYFKEVVAAGKPAVGKPSLGRFSNKPIMPFAVPVLNSLGNVVALFAGFTLLSDPALLGSIENFEYKDFSDKLVLLSSRYRMIITGSDPTRIMAPEPLTGNNSLFQRFMSGYEGSGVSVNSRGIRLLYSAKKIPTPGWVVRVGLPAEIAFAPIRSMKNWAYSIALGLSLISSLLVWLVIRQALRPLHAATTLISDITEGHLPLQNIPVTQHDEVGQLLTSFNKHLSYRKQTEQALHESEKFLQIIIETEPECIKLLDADGALLQMNRAGLDMIQADSLEQVKGQRVSGLVVPEHRAAFESLLERVFTGESGTLQFEAVGLHGRHVWLETHAVPLRNDKGEIVALLSITRDITERKRTEEALRDAIIEAQRFREALDSVSAYIYMKDTRSCYIYANRLTLDLFHCSAEELVGSDDTRFFPLDTVRRLLEIDARVFMGEKTAEEIYVDAAEGEKRVYWEVKTPIYEQPGSSAIVGLLGISTDITEQKRAQGAIQAQAELLNLAHDAIIVRGIGDRITYWNKGAERIYGWMQEEVIGMVTHELLNTQFPKPLVEINAEVAEKGDWEGELIHIGKDGRYIVVESRWSIQRDNSGQQVAVLEINRDITKRKLAEESLKENEIKFRSITNTAQDAIILMNDEGRISYWNPAAEQMFGYSEEEATGQLLHMFIAPQEHHDAYDMGFERYKKTGSDRVVGKTIELEALRKDGSRFPIEISTSPIQIKKQWHSVGIIRDITERKQAEDALRENEAFLNSIIENIPTMIFVKDASELRFVRFNKAGEDLLGHSREELLGKNDYDFFPKNEADFFMTKDREVLDSKGLVDIPEETILTQVQGTRILHTRKIPILNREGNPEYLLGISEDITERITAEAQIKQSLKEKEMLLKEIHHRVKNNMAVVSSLLALQARKIEDPTVRSLFEESQQRVKSMALVHEKLYQTKDLSSINFEDYIKSIISEIINLHRIDTGLITTELNIEGIELDLESAVPCGLILNELLTNAFKYAFPDNRSGILRINFVKVDGTYTLTIKDNGIGLPEGFDYKKTKTLGLQIVNVLSEQLGGTLQIKSDGGTEAIVTFKAKRD